MVEVFKTDIESESFAKEVLQALHVIAPAATINFDLTDCDHILRVESEEDLTNHILNFSKKSGFFCQVLEDQPGNS